MSISKEIYEKGLGECKYMYFASKPITELCIHWNFNLLNWDFFGYFG
jgi:hypothetical protein